MLIQLTLALEYVIMIYAFIVWLLRKWNNEDIKR